MSPSKLAQMGELTIDHRDSPGITPEFMRANNLLGPCVGAGETLETGFKVCAHCGGQVFLHASRTRDREWCRACDAYLCDNCGLLRKLGAPHKPHRQLLGELFDATQKGRLL